MPTTREITFTKMQGAGNDYVYIDCTKHGVPADIEMLACDMSDRHFGVGGDGIILITRSEIADFGMRIFNADGSEAKMCGNGSRCVARYVYDNRLTDKSEITLETLSGIRTLHLNFSEPGKVESVTVDMGRPNFSAKEIPVVCKGESYVDEVVATSVDGDLRISAVSMGNPHGVIVVDNIDDIDFEHTGPELENHAMWPDRANIEFAQILSRNEIRVRVWERGSGETLACGTGACATAVTAILLGLCDHRVTIHLRGGDLTVEWAGGDSHVYMTGGAEPVFEGKFIRRR